MTTVTDVKHMIGNAGLQVLGLAAPLLAGEWATGGLPTTADHGWSLTGNGWLAPAAGILNVGLPAANAIIMPAGITLDQSVAVLRLNPQAYLRISRLIATIIENRTDDVLTPLRPIPFYFVYRGLSAAPAAGKYFAGDPLGANGTLTVHDQRGLPIDPVAVAELFFQLLSAHDVLEMRVLGTTPSSPSSLQLNDIAAIAPADETRVHLITPHGKPVDEATIGDLVDGLGDSHHASGLYKLTASNRKVERADDAADSLQVGPATFGTVGKEVEIPEPAVTLRRDFVRLLLFDVKPFLVGSPDSSDPANEAAFLPKVRHNETLTISVNGNAAMGAANAILDGSPDRSIVVSPEIHSDFTLPDDATNEKAQWPKFPDPGAQSEDAVPYNIFERFQPTAHFVEADGEATHDVVLVLGNANVAEGLTPGLAIRVFNRRFLASGKEARGDGAGGIVKAGDGRVALFLRDPLGLGDSPIPTTATLNVDVAVINSKNQTRVIGNLEATVEAAAPLSAEEQTLLGAPSNPFNTEADTFLRGVAPADVVGLKPRDPSAVIDPDNMDAWELVLALAGADTPGDPYDAPRLPTMARRDTLVVAGSMPTSDDPSWKAQLSGLHLERGTRNARQRLGSPGAPGGKAYRGLSVQTEGGRLAYDMARAGLRRSMSIYDRLKEELDNEKWLEAPAASSGTFSAALLQTVSPLAETPVLSLFESQLSTFPETWSDLIDEMKSPLPGSVWGHLPNSFTGPIDNSASSDVDNMRYAEFLREVYASIYGRRDAVAALKRVIGEAQEWIYLEGPAFGATDYPDDSEDNLVELIRQRMEEVPGLQVMISLPKYLDYGTGYTPVAAREYTKRRAAVEQLALSDLSSVTLNTDLSAKLDKNDALADLQSAFAGTVTLSGKTTVEMMVPGKWWRIADPDTEQRLLIRKEDADLKAYRYSDRVVVFHPVGFPGRSQVLKTNLIIVDDVWAMIGSSTIRRRGLTFDGGLDLVLFDRRIHNGRSRAIQELRHRIMAEYLGIDPPADGEAGHPDWVRTREGHEAIRAIRTLLEQGGGGLIEPLWNGPSFDPPLTPPHEDMADPDGRDLFDAAQASTTFAGLLVLAGLAN